MGFKINEKYDFNNGIKLSDVNVRLKKFCNVNHNSNDTYTITGIFEFYIYGYEPFKEELVETTISSVEYFKKNNPIIILYDILKKRYENINSDENSPNNENNDEKIETIFKLNCGKKLKKFGLPSDNITVRNTGTLTINKKGNDEYSISIIFYYSYDNNAYFNYEGYTINLNKSELNEIKNIHRYLIEKYKKECVED
jgi:hypothetical protein